MDELSRDFQAELRDVATTFEPSEDYRELREFYHEMVSLGLVVKHPYGFGPSDGLLPRLAHAPAVEAKSWFGAYLEQSVR